MWLDLHEGILEEFASRAAAPEGEHWAAAGLCIRHEDNVRGMTERRVRTAWRSRHKTAEWRAYNTQWQRDHAEERNRRKRERRAAAKLTRGQGSVSAS